MRIHAIPAPDETFYKTTGCESALLVSSTFWTALAFSLSYLLLLGPFSNTLARMILMKQFHEQLSTQGRKKRRGFRSFAIKNRNYDRLFRINCRAISNFFDLLLEYA